MGLCFWSKYEDAGQYRVPAFEDPQTYLNWLANYYPNDFIREVVFHEVWTQEDLFASVAEMRQAKPPIPENALSPLIPNQPN